MFVMGANPIPSRRVSEFVAMDIYFQPHNGSVSVEICFREVRVF
jgi:hypothetical protein